MKIQLTDNHFVESDSSQYILKMKRINEEGNETERVLGYYGTIEQLVKGLVEKEIKSAQVHGIKSLINYLDDLENRITTTLHGVGIPALLGENENNHNLISQLERRNKLLEKQLEELKDEYKSVV